MKKKLLTGLSVMTVLSLAACNQSNTTTQTDAPVVSTEAPEVDENVEVLVGTAKGFGGIVTATVTVKDGEIINIEVDGPDETDGIGTLALKELPVAIMAAGNTDVDAVATATITSDAILTAVNNALNPDEAEEIAADTVRAEVPMEENSVKTGFGAYITMADSKNADEEDGIAKVDAFIAAVAIDTDGVIVDCKVDYAETVMPFTAEGIITADGDVHYQTKAETDSAWSDEASAFADSIIGMTQDEIETLEADDFNTGLIKALAQAIESSLSLGGTTADKLGLGTVTVMEYDQGSHTRDASDEKEGQAQAYSSYAAVTVNEDGIITSCVINASQGNINFTTEGILTTDVDTVFETKLELGDRYGMKGRSELGLEWFEQSFALADFVTGKTAEEVAAMELEDGRPTDADVVTSVSITVTDLQEAVLNAVANAK